MKPEKVVLAGGSGFIGRPLCRALFDNGAREVWVLSRRPRMEVPYAHVLAWDGQNPGPWQNSLEGAEALINLCGAGIAERRWTKARKKQLEESRILPTRALVAALSGAKNGPKVFLSASAVGYYGDRGDEPLDESAGCGSGFLALLCKAWEQESLKAPREVRTVLLRTGIVLGEGGGALREMLPLFRFGLGGPLGTGRQYMSWISREDEIGLILHLLSSQAQGAVNATAPEPVRNEEFARVLGQALNRPARLRIPAGVLKLALGELAEVLLGGQRVIPKKAQETGYAFKYPRLAAAIDISLR